MNNKEQAQTQSTPFAEHQHEGDKVMNEALAARAQGIHEVAKAREKIGRPVFNDSGVLLTEGDLAREQQYREQHGEPSEDIHVALPQ